MLSFGYFIAVDTALLMRSTHSHGVSIWSLLFSIHAVTVYMMLVCLASWARSYEDSTVLYPASAPSSGVNSPHEYSSGSGMGCSTGTASSESFIPMERICMAAIS